MTAVRTCCEKPRRARSARTRDSRGCSIIAGCHEQEVCGPGARAVTRARACNPAQQAAAKAACRRWPPPLAARRRRAGGAGRGPEVAGVVRSAPCRARAGPEAAKWESRSRRRRQRPACLEVCMVALRRAPSGRVRWQGVCTGQRPGSLAAAACLPGILGARKRPGQDRIYGKAGRCRAARPGLLLTFSIRCYRLFVTIPNTAVPSLFF